MDALIPSPTCSPLLPYHRPQVDAFYNFWYAFKSWREFPHPDEEDIEQVRGMGKSWVAVMAITHVADCAVPRAVMCAVAATLPCTSLVGSCSLHSSLTAGGVAGAPPLD